MTLAYSRAVFDRPVAGNAWRTHLGWLALCWAALLIAFRNDVGDILHIWWNSTTFGHCLFVPPVIGWLVWQRRDDLARVTPVAWWPGLALVAAGGFGWLLGDASSTALARQLGLVLMMAGAVVTLLGPNVARGLLFPLGYMVFLVPFGEGLETPLQGVTVRMAMALLHGVGVPAQVDGVLITIPNGYFEVAEACSGAKFVIAMVAYGALVANVCYVSWPRRIAFMAMAVVVPILANGVRAFGTIYAAHLTSVEAATGYDHIVYGWVFFGLVMAAVLAIGWRWFDRDPAAPWFDADALQGRVLRRLDLHVAVALVLVVPALFLGWSAAVAGRAQVLPADPRLPDIAGWHRVAPTEPGLWQPHYPGADRMLFARYVDDRGEAVDLAVAIFGHQAEGRELVAFGTGVLRENDRWVRVDDEPALAGGSVMRITAPGPVEREVATWYRAGDVLTSDESLVKIETTRAKLLGGPQRAVAIHLSAREGQGHDARAAMAHLLAGLGPLDRLADRLSGTPD